MKRLLILLLLAAAAWYGWKHYPELLQKRDGHDVVIENTSGRNMERIRVMVDGQTLVRESLPDGETATMPFKVVNDATFRLEWQYSTAPGTHTWSGGMVPKGPMMQRHIMAIQEDDAVMYRADNK